MVLAAQRRLLGALTLSLALTAAAVVTISIGLVRGGRLALAAVVPNLWPVAVALGAMGWLGVPIDAATVMIAAVVLGVAVDDTLHYLGALRRAGGGRAPAAAARWALEEVAPAHLLTTLVLAGGFAVLAGSSFLPVARFGGVAAMALLAALAADFLWVPALTAAARRRELARFTRRPAGDRPPRG
ncbi:MAG: RND transporter, partial [Thermoanaerobaculia bacterium]|nr:RND transporter [Thermoanaerobaculia bacterium]